MSENGTFAVGLYQSFEKILSLYEAVTEGVSKKNRELLAKNKRLQEEIARLRAELEARIKVLEGQRK